MDKTKSAVLQSKNALETLHLRTPKEERTRKEPAQQRGRALAFSSLRGSTLQQYHLPFGSDTSDKDNGHSGEYEQLWNELQAISSTWKETLSLSAQAFSMLPPPYPSRIPEVKVAWDLLQTGELNEYPFRYSMLYALADGASLEEAERIATSHQPPPPPPPEQEPFIQATIFLATLLGTLQANLQKIKQFQKTTHKNPTQRSHLKQELLEQRPLGIQESIRENVIQLLQKTPSNPNTRLPQILNAFPNGLGRFPNNPFVFTAMESIWKGGAQAQKLQKGWKETKTGRLVYEHAGNQGGKIRVYPNMAQPDAPLPTTGALWDFVEELNPFTGDVALAVLAQLCEPTHNDRPKYPLLESVKITTDAILGYKGIQRWGVERKLLWKRVMEEMRRLAKLNINVEKYPAIDPDTGDWNPQGFSWKNDRLFDIVEVERYQATLSGEHENIEVMWSVRAGQWARYWLNPQGRVLVGKIARSLLELNHRHNKGPAVMAKKIGQSVMFLSNTVQKLQPLRIGNLLERIGELPTPDQRSKNWAGRTRARFDEALATLLENEILADVQWPKAFQPHKKNSTKGWVDRWLNSKISMTLPELPPQPYLPLPPSQHLLPHNPPASLGQRLRSTRQRQGLTQAKLARILGIRRTYLSQIENDKRSPSDKLQSKIQHWLQHS